MTLLPPHDGNLEERLRAYYRGRPFTPPPASESFWTRLAPFLDEPALPSPSIEHEQGQHRLLSHTGRSAPSGPPPIPAVPPARHHRLFVGASALVAGLVVVLLAVAIFGFFALAPQKTSSPVIVLDRSKITLLSISMISTSEGWAVGTTNGNDPQGIILHYHQGRWWQVDNPYNTGELRSIFMLSASDGWVVGDKGTILHYTGGRWVQVKSPVTTALGSVFMSSTTDGWAAGEALLHYHNGTWTAVSAPGHGFIFSLYMLAPSLGWAVGSGGTILQYTGGHWQAAADPRIDLYSLSMIASNVGWAVGGSGGSSGNLLYYQNGIWSVVQTPDPQATLSAIALAVPGVSEEGWAVGHNSVGTAGLLLHDHNGQWTEVPSPTPGFLLGIALISPSEGWAVGSQGTILHYLNGVWSSYTDAISEEMTQTLPATDDLSQVELTSISMISPDEGWAAGNMLPYQDTYYGGSRNQALSGSPVILHYQHGRWTPQPLPDLSQMFHCGTGTFSCSGIALNSISMVSAQEGWAVGNTVPPANVTDIGGQGILLHYIGGKWVLVNIQAQYLRSLFMRSASDGWMIGVGLGFDGGGPSEVWHYDGNAWAPVSNPVLSSIAPFAVTGGANGDIWISGIDYSVSVGDGFDGNAPAALLHYDGTRWSKVDPHIANGRLYSFAFTSPDEGWAVGTLPNTNQHPAAESDGLIVWYHNGAWQEQTHFQGPFGQAYYSLTGVAMISSDEGWAVGNEGVIMHYANGAWTMAQSPTGEDLSSVVMVSASEGWAIGNHGTILHYQGGVWSLYQGA